MEEFTDGSKVHFWVNGLSLWERRPWAAKARLPPGYLPVPLERGYQFYCLELRGGECKLLHDLWSVGFKGLDWLMFYQKKSTSSQWCDIRLGWDFAIFIGHRLCHLILSITLRGHQGSCSDSHFCRWGSWGPEVVTWFYWDPEIEKQWESCFLTPGR